MKKRITRWLLAATAFVGISCFGMANTGYALENQAIAYTEDSVLKDDEAIIEYVNEQFIRHNETIVFDVSEEQYAPMDIVKLISSCDCYYDLESASFSYMLRDGIMEFYVNCQYITTDKQNEEFEFALDKAMKELNLDGKTDYQKVRLIHDYICDNVDYDYENLSRGESYMRMYSSYAALIDKKAVCQGYAGLFYRMCYEADVSSKIIAGNGNGQRHAWNIVKIGDEYFNIDTTWDGQDEETFYDFFLKSETDFAAHYRDSEYETEEFNNKYKMAASSWIDFEKFTGSVKFNYNNLAEYTYTTLSGKKVNNQAQGKPKILIYGDTGRCTNAAMTASSLSSGNFGDVDIIFIDCFDNTYQTVSTFEAKNIKGKFDIAYGTDESIDSSFWAYANGTLGLYGSVIPPFVVYIDENNIVQYAEIQGYFSADHVREMINTYIKGNKPVELSNETIALEKGEEAALKILIYGTQKNSQFFTWSSSDKTVASVDENGVIKAHKSGEATITCKINDNIYLKCDVEVTGEMTVTSTVSKNNIAVGDTITFTTMAEGGAGTYTYSLIVKNENTGEWARIKNNVSANSFTWKAGSAGTRTFYIDVKDENGQIVRSQALKVVTAQNLSVKASADVTSNVVGDTVKFSATAKGGSGNYTYSLIVKNETTGEWARIKDNVSESTFTWKAKSAGKRTFYIDVKDSTGKVVRSSAITVVTEKAATLSVSASATASVVSKGDNVTIKGVADGGTAPYTYSFVVNNKENGKWYRYQFSNADSLIWKASGTGTRLFYVEAKDSKGNVIRSKAVVIEVK